MQKTSLSIIRAEIAEHWKPRTHWLPNAIPGVPVVGRNKPCPCGSGKKYKRCHGKPGPRELVDVASRESYEEIDVVT